MPDTNPDPNKVTQITSNADIEAIVSEYVEEITVLSNEADRFGLPPYPHKFLEHLFGQTREIQRCRTSKADYEHYYAVFYDPKGMYDSGYKLEEAQKFIRDQQQQILNNIIANFKNIPGISQVDTSNICEKFPTDDSRLIKESLRGNIILTYAYQMMFLDIIKDWNSKAVKNNYVIKSINNEIETIALANDEDTDEAEATANKYKLLNQPGLGLTPEAVQGDPKTPNKKEYGNDIGQLPSFLAQTVIDAYKSDSINSVNVIDTKNQNNKLLKNATETTVLGVGLGDDIVSKNIEYNKDFYEKIIEQGKNIVEGFKNKFENSYKTEIKNEQNKHTDTRKLCDEYFNKYFINEFKFDSINTSAVGKDTTADFDEKVWNNIGFFKSDNWSDYNTNGIDKQRLFLGALAAEAGGFKPIYSINCSYNAAVTAGSFTNPGTDVMPNILDGYDPHKPNFNIEFDVITFPKYQNPDSALDNSDKQENHTYTDDDGEEIAIIKDKYDYPDLAKQKQNNSCIKSLYPVGNISKINKAWNYMLQNCSDEDKQLSSTDYSKKITGQTNGEWTFKEYVLLIFKEYFGLNPDGSANPDKIQDEKFIGKKLSKYFIEINEIVKEILSNKYAISTLTNGNIDSMKYTYSISDTFFDYYCKDFIAAGKGDISTLPGVDKPDIYLSSMIYNKESEFPMDAAPVNKLSEIKSGIKDANIVNKYSILFEKIFPSIVTELESILTQWSSKFKNVNHSYNADWMKDNKVLNDILCTPIGLAYCYFISTQAKDYYNKDIDFKNIEKILKYNLATNLIYKLVLPLIDVNAVNKYLIYEILYNAIYAEEIEFIQKDIDEPVPEFKFSTGFKEDLRSPARLFTGSTTDKEGTILNNVISLYDYNWGPVYNLGHERVNPADFSKLIIWEFQPNATVSTSDMIKGASSILSSISGFKLVKSTATSKKDGADKNVGLGGSSAAMTIAKIGSSNVINAEISSINGSSAADKIKSITNVDWVNNLLTGYWIGRYEIPFFNNNFMKAKSKEAWEMGNALKGHDGLIGTIRDGLQSNVQDVPLWNFDNASNNEGINWNTSFFLINDNVTNIKKNLAFISAFTAGTYWIQLNQFQYHCPNLYRVECPGRFFELYTSLDITINYFGKTQKISNTDREKIFGGKDAEGIKLFNANSGCDTIFIPEAYEIIVDSKSLQPNAFNIQYNYLLTGGNSMRPDMSSEKNRTVESSNFIRSTINSSTNMVKFDAQDSKIEDINKAVNTMNQQIEDKMKKSIKK